MECMRNRLMDFDYLKTRFVLNIQILGINTPKPINKQTPPGDTSAPHEELWVSYWTETRAPVSIRIVGFPRLVFTACGLAQCLYSPKLGGGCPCGWPSPVSAALSGLADRGPFALVAEEFLLLKWVDGASRRFFFENNITFFLYFRFFDGIFGYWRSDNRNVSHCWFDLLNHPILPHPRRLNLMVDKTPKISEVNWLWIFGVSTAVGVSVYFEI